MKHDVLAEGWDLEGAMEGARRFLRRHRQLSWGTLANMTAFSMLLFILFFWEPRQLNVSLFFFAGGFGDPPQIPALQLARAKQRTFCTKHHQGRSNPRWLEVPWSPEGSSAEEVEGGGMAGLGSPMVQLILRQGLQARVAGISEPFQQYLFAANDIVSTHMQKDGEWERGELTMIVRKLQQFARARRLKPRDVFFVDVGANVGVYTLFVAAYGFNVLAFEPLHANVLALRHSLCANPHLMDRVTLLTQGLGNSTQWCGIWTLITNQGDGTVFCQGNAAAPSPSFRKRQDLEISRMDDSLAGALSALAGRVGAMKVDVEGHELSVMQGAAKFFEVVQPAYIMTECNDEMMSAATGQPASALLLKMYDLGYQVHQGSFEGPGIQRSRLESWREPQIVNYWFTRRSLI